jgi:hypothetical protein
VTKRPHFASHKAGHVVTGHFGEGGNPIRCEKVSTSNPRWTKNTWTDFTGVRMSQEQNCHSRQSLGWTYSLGPNVAWLVVGGRIVDAPFGRM